MNPIAEEIRFGPDGLLPAIIQDASDGTVLMLAYMNREALTLTLHTGYTHFWSRSRQTLWQKGEESGNVQRVVAIHYDCDGDTLLVQVAQQNVACHTGQRSCFFRTLPLVSTAVPAGEEEVAAAPAVTEMLAALYHLILLRRDAGDASSYVYRLFQRGPDGMCKKVVEEAAEVLLASKNGTSTEIVYEMADLWFHALVLLGYHGVHPHEVLRELQRRFGLPGGGKAAASLAHGSPPPHDAEA
jgi:phosphoribosyl-ATP pyrophosphohydrolase/phosphoribosyl-AMP cyclohydrolase